MMAAMILQQSDGINPVPHFGFLLQLVSSWYDLGCIELVLGGPVSGIPEIGLFALLLENWGVHENCFG